MQAEVPAPEATGGVADTGAVARGTRYSAIAQAATQVLRFGTNVVLARLLTPDAFGVVAIALVVTMLLDQVKDMGTGSALIQRREVDDRLLNSVFYLNLFLGSVLAAAMFGLASVVARLMGNPDAEPALRAFALVTLITSLGQIHHSLLRRNLRFFELAVAMTVGSLVTALVAIPTAFAGFGFWALVWGTGAGAVASTALVWVYDRWRPSWSISLSSLRSIWSYSYHLFLSNILYLGFNQVDKVIISHFLGATPLGAYTIAQRTVLSPVQAVGQAVGEVAFPAFSRRQDDHQALGNGFTRASAAIALITFPVTFGLAALAGPAVAVVFGPRWEAVVPVIQVLAPVAALQSVTFNSSQLLLAKGRSDTSYRWGVVYCVVLTTFELVGVRWGLVGVTVAFGAGVALLTPFSLMLAFRPVGLRLWHYTRSLLPHLAINLVMVVCAMTAAWLVRRSGGGSLPELLGGAATGAVVYGVLIGWLRPLGTADALATIARRRG